ncbi:MAG: HP0495 family protein [Woeseiaceae bacterium]
MGDEEKEKLLDFPCEFPIKMMGRESEHFRRTAIALVEEHTGKLEDSAIRSAPSSKGNFLSITVTIVAHSQDQLDNIYRALSNHEDILVAL